MGRPTRSSWPAGLLGMLAMVAGIEAAISRHPLRFQDTASLSWSLAVGAIPREAGRCEVACLGDSLVKIGVIPRVIEAEAGRPAYNFAMAQAPAPATFFLFRRLIEAGGRPSAIVVDFKPSILAGGPRYSLRRWQTILDVREAVELARESRSLGLFLEIGLGRLLPSYRDRLEIREAIASALLGREAPTHSTNRLALRNWSVNRGAHLNSARPRFDGLVGEGLHDRLLSDRWKCNRLNAAFVDRLLTLADSRLIPVTWLIPPLAPSLQTRRERSGVDAAFAAFVGSMRAKHPALRVVDARHSGYDDATFADHSHLNGRGAIALSRSLAAILARSGGQAGWLDLPNFADGPSSYPVEDIDQSRVALEAGTARR